MEWHAKHIHGARQPKDKVQRIMAVVEPERTRYGLRLKDELEAKDLSFSVYSFAIPCFSILKAIGDGSPHGILELGAGSGYWSYLLSLVPVDVVAVDRGVKENQYAFEKLWYPVVEQDGREAVRDPAHAKRTLLLCWPDASWAAECLHLSSSSTLAYVGHKGCAGTGGDSLAAEIRDHWRPVRALAMPNWYGDSTRLAIYKRRVSVR